MTEELQDNKTQGNWFKNYVRENPVSFGWLLALSFGGLILFSFHLGLGYIPDFTLTDLVGILISTALTGVAFLCFVMAFVVMPAYFLKLFDKKIGELGLQLEVVEKERLELISNSTVDPLAHRDESSQGRSVQLFTTGFDHFFLWAAPPLFLVFLVLVFGNYLKSVPLFRTLLLLVVGIVLLLWTFVFASKVSLRSSIKDCLRKIFFEKLPRSVSNWMEFVVGGLFLKVVPRKVTQRFVLFNKSVRIATSNVRGRLSQSFCVFKLFGFMIWLTLSVLPAYVAALFAEIGLREHNEATFFLFVVFFGFINLLVYVAADKFKILVILSVGAVVMSTLMPLWANHTLLFPEVIVRLIGLGNIKATNLTLSYKQCNLLLPIGVSCPQITAREPQMALQNVNILSKIGPYVLIEIVGSSNGVADEIEKNKNSKFQSINFDQNFKNNLCKKNSDQSEPVSCSSCDAIVLDRATDSIRERMSYEIRLAKKSSSNVALSDDEKKVIDFEVAEFKKTLVCYRVLIPKDQISNIGFGGSRSYLGLTSYALPEQTR